MENIETLDDVDFSDVFEEINKEMSDTENAEADTPVDTEDEVDDFEKENEENLENESKKENVQENVQEEKAPEFDFEITYNGVKQKLTKEEAIALAQKGMDYDRIRSDHEFLKEFADQTGQSVEEYKSSLKEKARDFGIQQLMEEKNISQDVAEELYDSRQNAIKSMAIDKEQKQKQAEQDKITAELQRLKQFKPDVEIDKIPKATWEKVANGMSLIEAVMLDEVNKLRDENSILKTNAKNKEQEIITGTKAQAEVKDEIDEAWDNA